MGEVAKNAHLFSRGVRKAPGILSGASAGVSREIMCHNTCLIAARNMNGALRVRQHLQYPEMLRFFALIALDAPANLLPSFSSD